MLTAGLKSSKGETLIEALLAFTIFSMALVVAMRTMNQGFTHMYVSGQRSQVQSLISGQMAILRQIHDEAAGRDNLTGSKWTKLKEALSAGAENHVDPSGCSNTVSKIYFYFSTNPGGDWSRANSVPNPKPLAYMDNNATPSPGSWLWIETQYVDQPPRPAYYDFYVKACWDTAIGVQELKSTVRLYDIR